MSVFHDEIEVEDFEYDEEEEMYYYPCPCGDRFQISKVGIFFVRKLVVLPNNNIIDHTFLLGRAFSRRRSRCLSQLFSYRKSDIRSGTPVFIAYLFTSSVKSVLCRNRCKREKRASSKSATN